MTSTMDPIQRFLVSVRGKCWRDNVLTRETFVIANMRNNHKLKSWRDNGKANVNYVIANLKVMRGKEILKWKERLKGGKLNYCKIRGRGKRNNNYNRDSSKEIEEEETMIGIHTKLEGEEITKSNRDYQSSKEILIHGKRKTRMWWNKSKRKRAYKNFVTTVIFLILSLIIQLVVFEFSIDFSQRITPQIIKLRSNKSSNKSIIFSSNYSIPPSSSSDILPSNYNNILPSFEKRSRISFQNLVSFQNLRSESPVGSSFRESMFRESSFRFPKRPSSFRLLASGGSLSFLTRFFSEPVSFLTRSFSEPVSFLVFLTRSLTRSFSELISFSPLTYASASPESIEEFFHLLHNYIDHWPKHLTICQFGMPPFHEVLSWNLFQRLPRPNYNIYLHFFKVEENDTALVALQEAYPGRVIWNDEITEEWDG